MMDVYSLNYGKQVEPEVKDEFDKTKYERATAPCPFWYNSTMSINFEEGTLMHAIFNGMGPVSKAEMKLQNAQNEARLQKANNDILMIGSLFGGIKFVKVPELRVIFEASDSSSGFVRYMHFFETPDG